MRKLPARIANNPDHWRPRALRTRSGRGLGRFIEASAAPRVITTGSAGLTSAADEGGSFSGGGATGGHIYTGDPITGATYAICGHSVCDSSQVCGP